MFLNSKPIIIEQFISPKTPAYIRKLILADIRNKMARNVPPPNNQLNWSLQRFRSIIVEPPVKLEPSHSSESLAHVDLSINISKKAISERR